MNEGASPGRAPLRRHSQPADPGEIAWQRDVSGTAEYLEGRHVDNSSFETVSLGDYFGVIWRRKWIVILVTILFGVAGLPVLDASARSCMRRRRRFCTTPAPRPRAARRGHASDWGLQYAPFAQSSDFAAQVVKAAHVIPALTATQLMHNTTIAPIPAGNGLQFTVSNPSALNAAAVGGCLQRSVPELSRSEHA